MSTISEIFASRGTEIGGKRIIHCVTGSIAAIKAPEIARELIRHSADVTAVMTPDAVKIIHPNAMEWATGHSVVTELTGRIENVEFLAVPTTRADLVLVAPATDNTISKVAVGVNDTAVTAMVTTALGAGIPVVMCPAMHEAMYRQSILESNLQKLRTLNVEFITPTVAEGKAKIAEVESIVEAVIRRLSPKDLQGVKMLMTGGPTHEPIDPVRIITNRSSGKMAVSLAREALRRGARVTIIYGPAKTQLPPNAEAINVTTSQEMHEAAVSLLKDGSYDVFLGVAAVADYTLLNSSAQKIPTHEIPRLTLHLQATPKILDAVKKISPHTYTVGFKAEANVSDDELTVSATRRMKEGNADLIVANDITREGVGFEYETNEVIIVSHDSPPLKISRTTKDAIARRIIDIVAQVLAREEKIQ